MGSKAFPPTEPDGRQVFVNAPMSKGMMTFFTGAGDDLNPTPPESGIGMGQKINFDFTGAGDQTVTLEFSSCIELHDGQLFYSPVASWTHDDRLDFLAVMPASPVTPNSGGTGNCDLTAAAEFGFWSSATTYNPGDVVTGYDGINYVCIATHTNQQPPDVSYWSNYANMIIPAASDGDYDIDLNAASPVDASHAGYWECDRDSGDVTVSSTPGAGGWYLLDMDISAYFMRNMPMGHPMGVLDVDTYKSEWIHRNWKLKIRVLRETSGVGTAAGWLLTYRKNVQ